MAYVRITDEKQAEGLLARIHQPASDRAGMSAHLLKLQIHKPPARQGRMTTATAAVQEIGRGLKAGRDGTYGQQQQACDIPRLEIPLQTFIDSLGGNRSGWRHVPDIRTERNAGGAGICRQ